MTCERFEREGLGALAADHTLDAHIATCADCRQAQTAYRRLTEELHALRVAPGPPAGWEQRVWATVRQRPAPNPERPRWWWPALLATAATLLISTGIWIALIGPRAAGQPQLALTVLPPDGAPRRSDAAQPGSRLALRADVGGYRFAELRLYRNDVDLLLRCADGPEPCQRRGDALEARFVVQTLGEHQPVLIVSERPIPAPRGGGARALDEDAAAATAAGAQVILGAPVSVR